MNYAGKWMELENINLNEVTQTQKESMVCSDKWILAKKFRIPMIHSTDCKEAKQEGRTKWGKLGYHLEGDMAQS